MKDSLLNISIESNIWYILEDYDLNLIDGDSHELTGESNDTLYLNGVMPFTTRPSRISNNSATLIDYIYTDLLLNQLNSVLLNEITDYYPIFRYIQEGRNIFMTLR